MGSLHYALPLTTRSAVAGRKWSHSGPCLTPKAARGLPDDCPDDGHRGVHRARRELGDSAWRDLVQQHHRVVRAALRRHGGREIDTAGDGFFAISMRRGGSCVCNRDHR